MGQSQYVRNQGMPDAELAGMHIAKRGKWSDAIILFSMGLTRSSRGRLAGGQAVLSQVFLEHLIIIVNEIAPDSEGSRSTHAYAQTERESGGIGRLLRRLGFEDTELRTGDGFSLWKIEVTLPRGNRRLVLSNVERDITWRSDPRYFGGGPVDRGDTGS